MWCGDVAAKCLIWQALGSNPGFLWITLLTSCRDALPGRMNTGLQQIARKNGTGKKSL
jgi:hypothetical protein